MTRHACIPVLLMAALAVPASAQDRRGFEWNDRPRIVFGEDINLDFKGRVQLDWRTFDPDIQEETFDPRTIRVGLQGELTRHFDWEIEREIDEVLEAGAIEPEWGWGQWKDVFINWSTFDAVRVKAGRFKMPFGLEQTTSVSDLDFAYRALGSVTIAPGRDTGVMVYGDLLDGALVYEAGVFDDDGDNAELEEERFIVEGQDLEGLGPSFAARVVGEIFRGLPVWDRMRGMEVGIAYTRADVPEGLNSLKGEDVWGYDFFEQVYVQGTRQRVGLQFDWSPGPTGFKAEWMQSREQRLEQSNRDEDLSDFIGTAWYASATWLVTGEDKDSDVQARRPLFQGGFGAVELGIRYDELTFKSASTDGADFTNPRSEHLTPNTDATLTLGVNWLVNRWVKVVVNGIRQSFDDTNRAPIVGTADYWAALTRLQVVF